MGQPDEGDLTPGVRPGQNLQRTGQLVLAIIRRYAESDRMPDHTMRPRADRSIWRGAKGQDPDNLRSADAEER